MFFHYALFNGITFDSGDLLQRIGFYGVSVFYILSGLTLYHIYRRQAFTRPDTLKSFAKKRIARIYPLFTAVTVLWFLYQRENDWGRLLLNITGLFAVSDWTAYFITGGWSIGNELVFYLFFPLLMTAAQKDKKLFAVLLAAAFLAYVYFSFALIDTRAAVQTNWRYYTNPLNQIFLFAAGIGIGVFFGEKTFKQSRIGLLFCLTLLLFVFYPSAETDVFSLVHGKERLIFTLLSVLTVFCFFKSAVRLPRCLHRLFLTAGEISYGIYLLHPVVFAALKKLPLSLPIPVLTCTAVLLTAAVSYCSYRFFEQRFIRFAADKQQAT